MKYSVIESVFLGGYKSIVDLDFQLFFCFFFFMAHPPAPRHSITQTLICSFFQEMELHWWQEKYFGINVLNFTFLQLF